ncbi:MAG: galactose mutarotase [Muribaculaceae bacterium]|nr:galactose mutarotase [Muribaculaceae bacterium]
MKITSKTFPSAKGDITWFELTNAQGASVTLSTMGAGIVKVCVPDKDGKIENVALSYAEAADYIADGPCLGKCPGRFANRIENGHLEINGKEYQLTINNGPNALHGGPEGFQNQNWDAEVLEDGVKFTYFSKDGEEQYPGNLTVTATYHWSDDNVLTLDFHAETDADTVVNLTNHAYWNLDGADAGKIFDHKMKIKASKWLPQTPSSVPNGVIAATGGSPMDFRIAKRIGEDINRDFTALKIGKGYDHCWAFDGWEPGKMIMKAVELEAAKSGRKLIMSTDQPGVQIYTGNWLDGSPKNCSGKSYEDYDGVAIEMQGFPDAPNKPHFPTALLKAGESYDRKIVFDFQA